jgi:hypothetical protein
MDVVVWLRGLGLEQYEVAFRENEISERVLPSLTAEDLKELGITALGHRRIPIAALRGDTQASPPEAPQTVDSGRRGVGSCPRVYARVVESIAQ